MICNNGNNCFAINMSVSTEEDSINAMLLVLAVRLSSRSLMSLENAIKLKKFFEGTNAQKYSF